MVRIVWQDGRHSSQLNLLHLYQFEKAAPSTEFLSPSIEFINKLSQQFSGNKMSPIQCDWPIQERFWEHIHPQNSRWQCFHPLEPSACSTTL